MKNNRKYGLTLSLVAALVLILVIQVGAALTQGPDESQIEQDKALAAEQQGASAGTPQVLMQGQVYPLFAGVDDATVPAYLIDPATNDFMQAFVGEEVWGAAYDAENDIVYFNAGTTLFEWPVGGAITELGLITDPAGAAQSMVGLAFYNGQLYGTKNIATEAVWAIDTDTLVATIYITYPTVHDMGGLAIDPNTGEFYATDDGSTDSLVHIDTNGTVTPIAPYPAGQTDIDGLAISDDGFAYLIIDEPGDIYVYDMVGGAYVAPLDNPWTTSEIFSGGTYITGAFEPAIALTKTVGLVPGVCATLNSIEVPAGGNGTAAYYCYTAANTGNVTLTLHSLTDSELGDLLTDFPFPLGPGAVVNSVDAGLTISTVITQTTTNTALWTASDDAGAVVTATAVATVTVLPPTGVGLSVLSGGGTDMLPLILGVLLLALFAGGALIWRRAKATV